MKRQSEDFRAVKLRETEDAVEHSFVDLDIDAGMSGSRGKTNLHSRFVRHRSGQPGAKKKRSRSPERLIEYPVSKTGRQFNCGLCQSNLSIGEVKEMCNYYQL